MSERTFVDEAPKDPVELDARPSLLPYGTVVQKEWGSEWIERVQRAEKEKGKSICGARRNDADMDGLWRKGKITEEDMEREDNWVCTNRAGAETQHEGRGLCYRHGGNDSGGRFSLVSSPEFSSRVHNFFEDDTLLDLRGAVSMLWVAANSITENNDDGELSLNQAKELSAIMSRIGNLVKQHNEIMEKRKVSIEIPEFIAWAEHFYELAIKYILDGEKDVQGFLSEAKSYYDATVTIKVGLDGSGNSNRESHPFSGDEAQPILGPGISES